MKGKIFRFLIKFILPLVLAFLFLLITSTFFITGGKIFSNIVLTIMYALLNYYMAMLFIYAGRSYSDPNSVYMWLDKLNGDKEILKTLFLNIKSHKQVLVNLDFVYKKINMYTNYSPKNMKLLKGYFRTLDEENFLSLLHKTILSIIVAIVIWGISRGLIWNLSQPKGTLTNVSNIYLAALNFFTFVFEIILFLFTFIKDFFEGKRRNKIIIEVIDVCIAEIEEDKGKKLKY